MTEEAMAASLRRTSLFAVLVLCSVAIVFVNCGSNDEKGTATSTPREDGSPTRTTQPTQTKAPAVTDVGMELDEFAIRPNQTRALPGTITFLLTNAGEVPHEFVVIKSDLAVAELPRLPHDAGVDESDLDVRARLKEPLEPGAEGELSVDLDAGEYVLICNLAPNGESHYLNGMYTRFEVRSDLPLTTTTPRPTQ